MIKVYLSYLLYKLTVNNKKRVHRILSETNAYHFIENSKKFKQIIITSNSWIVLFVL